MKPKLGIREADGQLGPKERAEMRRWRNEEYLDHLFRAGQGAPFHVGEDGVENFDAEAEGGGAQPRPKWDQPHMQIYGDRKLSSLRSDAYLQPFPTQVWARSPPRDVVFM